MHNKPCGSSGDLKMKNYVVVLAVVSLLLLSGCNQVEKPSSCPISVVAGARCSPDLIGSPIPTTHIFDNNNMRYVDAAGINVATGGELNFKFTVNGWTKQLCPNGCDLEIQYPDGMEVPTSVYTMECIDGVSAGKYELQKVSVGIDSPARYKYPYAWNVEKEFFVEMFAFPGVNPSGDVKIKLTSSDCSYQQSIEDSFKVS